MGTQPTSAASAATSRTLAWARAGARPPVLHAVAAALLLVVLVPVTHAGKVAWADDDALYGLQVAALDAGHWDWKYPGAEFDEEGAWLPFSRGDRLGDRYFPYVRHPLYAALLFGSTRLFGDGHGFIAVSMLGLILAALAAWRLASEFHPRAGPPAFWLVAASPLLVNSMLPWAHTLGAALMGFALLPAVRMVSSQVTARRLGVLALLLAGAIWVRSEAALFAVALAMALLVALGYRLRSERQAWRDAVNHLPARRRRAGDLPPPPDRAVVRDGVRIVAVTAAVVTAALLAERWAVARIVGGNGVTVLGTRGPAPVRPRGSIGRTSFLDFISEQLHAVWRITFAGSRVAAGAAALTLVSVAIAALVTIVWPRIEKRRHAAWVPGVAAAALVALGAWRIASYDIEAVHGLFAAWPAVVAGLLAVPWRRTGAAERVLAGTCALFALGVFATQYPQGGGAEWGGRFLAPVIVPLSVVVAVGLRRRWETARMTPVVQRALVGCAAALVVMPAVIGLWMMHSNNRQSIRFVEDVESVATRTVAIDSRVHYVWQFPELAWRMQERHDFFRTRTDGKRLLTALYDAGYDDVTLIAFLGSQELPESPYAVVDDVTPPWTRSKGGRIVVLRR